MPAVKEMLAVAKHVLGYDLLQARLCLICHTAVHPGGTCELAVKQAPHVAGASGHRQGVPTDGSHCYCF